MIDELSISWRRLDISFCVYARVYACIESGKHSCANRRAIRSQFNRHEMAEHSGARLWCYCATSTPEVVMVTQWSGYLNLLHASNILRTIDSTDGFVRSRRIENGWNFNKNESKKKRKRIFLKTILFSWITTVLLNNSTKVNNYNDINDKN